MYTYARFVKTPVNLHNKRGLGQRRLEIGPGATRIPGFETVNIVWAKNVDYVADATENMPFPDNTFDLIHASHILEHTPWFELSQTLSEWVRILRPGGTIEIWVPDGYKLCQLLCDIENGIEREEWQDGWRPLNPENDPYLWINGRMLYGARSDYPSWHAAIITPRLLESLMQASGLEKIERLARNDVRSVDHGWINLGFRGHKA